MKEINNLGGNIYPVYSGLIIWNDSILADSLTILRLNSTSSFIEFLYCPEKYFDTRALYLIANSFKPSLGWVPNHETAPSLLKFERKFTLTVKSFSFKGLEKCHFSPNFFRFWKTWSISILESCIKFNGIDFRGSALIYRLASNFKEFKKRTIITYSFARYAKNSCNIIIGIEDQPFPLERFISSK